MIHGITTIFKEEGFTSHDVVAKMRGICGQKKIGHTGTLDPMATGVLPVCLGNATKLCDMLADRDKEYVAELLLGVETDTQDITGKVQAEHPVDAGQEDVRQAAASFVGEILEYALPVVRFRAVCSKGTYIRTLAADIGAALGCGGTMKSLQRTRVGEFRLEEARTLGEIQKLRDGGQLSAVVRPVDSVFSNCPALHIREDCCRLLDNGNAFDAAQTRERELHAPGRWVRVYRPDERFAGVYAWEPERKRYRPVKMFLEKE